MKVVSLEKQIQLAREDLYDRRRARLNRELSDKRGNDEIETRKAILASLESLRDLQLTAQNGMTVKI